MNKRRLFSFALKAGSIALAAVLIQAQETAPAPVTPAPAAAPLTAANVSAWLDGYLGYALHTGDIAGAILWRALACKLLSFGTNC
jgi:predicted lipid-binding transport protein (Tim44 family)